jgi:hypothetical protein
LFDKEKAKDDSKMRFDFKELEESKNTPYGDNGFVKEDIEEKKEMISQEKFIEIKIKQSDSVNTLKKLPKIAPMAAFVMRKNGPARRQFLFQSSNPNPCFNSLSKNTQG